MKYSREVYKAAYLEAAKEEGDGSFPASGIARILGVSREYTYVLRRRYGDVEPWNTERMFRPLPPDAQQFERVSHVMDGIFGPVPQTEAVVAAADRGTRIHAIVEDLIHGFAPEGEPDEVEAAQAAADTLRAIAGQNQILTEQAVFSGRLKVRGTADAIIVRPYPSGFSGPDAELVIVDVKTGQPSARHHLQQGGYAVCLLDMAREAGYTVDVKGYLLYVDREAKAKIKPTASPADRAAFEAAVALHRWIEVKR